MAGWWLCCLGFVAQCLVRPVYPVPQYLGLALLPRCCYVVEFIRRFAVYLGRKQEGFWLCTLFHNAHLID